jgi:hypothetical protein
MGGVFTRFWLGGPKVRDHWEDQGVGGRIILRWALGEIGIDEVNWIQVVQDRAQQRVFVNTVINLRVP